MSNFKMLRVDVLRKFILSPGGKPEMHWKLSVPVSEVGKDEIIRCSHCHGRVAIHRGSKIDEHAEHAPYEGEGCPIHEEGFIEEKAISSGPTR